MDTSCVSEHSGELYVFSAEAVISVSKALPRKAEGRQSLQRAFPASPWETVISENSNEFSESKTLTGFSDRFSGTEVRALEF